MASLPLDDIVLTAAVLGSLPRSLLFLGGGRAGAVDEGPIAQAFSRYAAVSVISTSVTLSLLGLLVYTKTLSPGWANVVAHGVGYGPFFRAEPALGLGQKNQAFVAERGGTVLRSVLQRSRAFDARRQAGCGLVGRGRTGPRCRGPGLPGRQPADFRFSVGCSVLSFSTGCCSAASSANRPTGRLPADKLHGRRVRAVEQAA